MAEEMTFSYELSELVVLQNLQKTPEHNGRLGVVKELLTAKNRLTVKLFESEKLLNVKEENMRKATDGELKTQLPLAFEKLRKDHIEAILSSNNVTFPADADKAKLVDLAVTAKLVPELSKKKVDLDEMVDIPGGGRLSRRQMQEQAKQLESMTTSQMREQHRILTSRSPQELRNSVPAMRNMTDDDIQAQISQMKTFLENPKLKKMQIEALKTGDFSKLNQNAVSSMSDREIRENAKRQLDAFKADPAAFRKQHFPDQNDLTDEDIEDMLNQQVNADKETLNMMRQQSRGGAAGAAGMDLSNMTEEQFKKNAELQLKMFKSNPKRLREQMEKQNPETKNLTDDQILMQLETMASMSKKDMEEMSKMAKSMGAGPGGMTSSSGANPNLDKMTGDQIKAMFKTQREMFKRDPKGFRKVVPQMDGMSDEAIQSQLDMMADMDPTMLKMLMAFQSKLGSVYALVKGPLDSISGGRGQQMIGVTMLVIAFLVIGLLFSGLWRLLAYLFPTTFGGLAAASASQGYAQAAAGTGSAPHTTTVQVELEEDPFFQDEEL